jgi:hypothetical protein
MVAAVLIASGLALQVAQAQQSGIKRTERRDRLCHRRLTGVSGRGQAAGDAQGRRGLVHPAGTIHAVKNVGSGNGAELATYVVEKGKPLVVLVK